MILNVCSFVMGVPPLTELNSEIIFPVAVTLMSEAYFACIFWTNSAAPSWAATLPAESLGDPFAAEDSLQYVQYSSGKTCVQFPPLPPRLRLLSSYFSL